MRVIDVVEPGVAEAVVTIDGAESTTDEVEAFFGIVGNAKIVVLHEGDVDEPSVGPEVRSTVVAEDVEEASLLDGNTDDGEDDDEANVGDNDTPLVVLAEERRARVEVVGGTVVCLRSDVEGEVSRPSTDEHAEELEQRDDGRFGNGFLEGFRELLGDEDGVLSQVVGVLVVSSMSDTPRVIGNENSGVEDETNEFVDGLGGREGTMTSFVGKDPQGSEVEALEEPEDVPDGEGEEHTGETLEHGRGFHEGRDDGGHDVVEGGDLDQVTDDVTEGTESVLLEHVSGDSATDLGKSEVLTWNRVAFDIVVIALGVVGFD